MDLITSLRMKGFNVTAACTIAYLRTVQPLRLREEEG